MLKFTKPAKILLILLILSLPVFGQMKDYSLKIGGQFNYLIPNTEFSDLEHMRFNHLTRAFVRFELSKMFELEFGGGFGYISGYDYYDDFYKTSLIEYGGRLIMRPFNYKSWNPYFFIGLERIHYEVDDWPKYLNRWDTDKDVLGIPAGVGVEFPLTETLIFDVSISGQYALDDGLNSYESNRVVMNDGHWNIGAGLTLSLKGDPDRDKDGLLNEVEEKLGTDPDNKDTDRDGLSDGEEVNKYRTDPTKKDTDGDTLSDSKEIKVHLTDPNKKDTDEDGLADNEEIDQYKTNPKVTDTDKDGLTDGDEVKKYKTDPLDKDTDNEGLNDGDEVKVHKTNPLKADTDDGSVNDYDEIKNGTDPLNGEDDVKKEMPKEEKDYKFENVYFATNKAELTSDSRKTLAMALRTLNEFKEIKIIIEGHTDSRGKASYNKALSIERAKSVKAWLTTRGVDASRIKVTGYGEDKPVADNNTPEGLAKNRRIEIKVID